MEAGGSQSHRSAEQQKDELLELLWLQLEDGTTSARTLLDDPRTAAMVQRSQEVLREAVAEGLVEESGAGLKFTDKGQRRAEALIRRNRLTLRLFHDLLDLPRPAATGPACALEHELSPEATEAICTLMGHPELDPEGRPIPRGTCCRSAVRKLGPLLVRLNDLSIGQTGRVCYMTPKFHERYDRLSAFGIVPGAVVRLLQKSPSHVLQVEGTTIAVDTEIAAEIFLVPRRDSSG